MDSNREPETLIVSQAGPRYSGDQQTRSARRLNTWLVIASMAWTANLTMPTILNGNVKMEVNMQASVKLNVGVQSEACVTVGLVENADLRKCWYCRLMLS
jgi:hypothetical protein